MPSTCSICGATMFGDDALCPYHVSAGADSDDWAAGNRIWCNFFHRGVPLERLKKEDRDDGYTAPMW